MQSSCAIFFAQLTGQAPQLLVYLLGLVLCAVWWRRAPSAAMYAMLGCGILLLTTVATSFIQVYAFNNRGGRPAATIGQIMFVIGIGGSILRAAGFGLLLAAVFAGRPRVVEQSGFEVQQAMQR
jgi:hypothetical protein